MYAHDEAAVQVLNIALVSAGIPHRHVADLQNDVAFL